MANGKPDRPWMTPKEAAPYMGISLRTLLNWINKGLLEVEQPGGPGTHNRIPIASIEEALHRKRGS